MIPGIHHVTAIASDAQANYDFYVGFLGLRLIKKTVNFDDPTTYHLYYGDATGAPGTILTFFPWQGARRGRKGTGQPTVISFAVPVGSLSYWHDRARERAVAVEGPRRNFEQDYLTVNDPDGLRVELVEVDRPGEHAILGFHSVVLDEEGYERTAELLTETMGFRLAAEKGNRFRFTTGDGGPGSMLDVLCLPAGQRGTMGAGTVHHVAWRTQDDNAQASWRDRIAAAGLNVTPIIDRVYFHSIYFREPGGVLFEIATDGPGFMVDEDQAHLGSELKLPPWYETMRNQIESVLPPLRTSAP
jgi:glyoxalase family protein